MKTKQKNQRNKSANKKELEKSRVQEREDQLQETESAYTEIQKLEDAGINVADINKLKAAGFCTVRSVLMVMKKELCNIKGFNDAKVEKIQDAARKMDEFGFKSGTEVSEMRKKVIKLSTGSEKLNTLLGGGLESMSITQAFGEFRTGKTQLAHTICVTAQLPIQQGGASGKVVYIDTEGTFRPEKIRKIAQRFGLDADETLENISYAKAYTSQQLGNLLVMAAALMSSSKYSLLIIDSIMACFRTDYMGRGQLSQRQQQLGRLLNRIMKLAEQFNLIVYLTNQVTADPGNSMAHMDPKKPVGGHVLAHASTVRLYCRKGKGQQRLVKVFDAPNLPESEEAVIITDAGIADVKD